MRTLKFAVFAAAAVCTVSLSACGGAPAPAAAPARRPRPSAAPMAPMAPSMAPMAAGETFGAGCAAVPTDASNPGSFAAMAKVPVATAASGNPVLSTLVTAVKKANLVDSLNSAQGITVFAPANSAFEKIPSNTLNGVLADNDQLTKVLTYHVVPGRLSPDAAGRHAQDARGPGPDGRRQRHRLHGQRQLVGGVRQRADRERDRLHRRHRADAAELISRG